MSNATNMPRSWQRVQQAIDERQNRTNKQYSLRDLERDSRANLSQLSFWRRGKELPGEQTIMKVCIEFNIPFTDLNTLVETEKQQRKLANKLRDAQLQAQIAKAEMPCPACQTPLDLSVLAAKLGDTDT